MSVVYKSSKSQLTTGVLPSERRAGSEEICLARFECDGQTVCQIAFQIGNFNAEHFICGALISNLPEVTMFFYFNRLFFCNYFIWQWIAKRQNRQHFITLKSIHVSQLFKLKTWPHLIDFALSIQTSHRMTHCSQQHFVFEWGYKLSFNNKFSKQSQQQCMNCGKKHPFSLHKGV